MPASQLQRSRPGRHIAPAIAPAAPYSNRAWTSPSRSRSRSSSGASPMACWSASTTRPSLVSLNRYADSFFDSPPVMADGVPEMLQTLKDRDYRIGLISNTGMTPGRLFRAYMEQLEILHYFDNLTFSDEVLLAKPSRAIFLHAMANLGCIADQTVHVGDHRRNDILGAQGAGIRTVWLEGVDDSSEVDVTPTITIQRIAELPEALQKLSAA